MCLFKSPSTPSVVQPTQEEGTTLSSTENQKKAEDERLRRGISTKGLSSTLLTSGIGAVAPPKVRGLSLGT